MLEMQMPYLWCLWFTFLGFGDPVKPKQTSGLPEKFPEMYKMTAVFFMKNVTFTYELPNLMLESSGFNKNSD
jgi:hypothetical protein